MPGPFESAGGQSPTWSRASPWLFAILLGITLTVSWSARGRAWIAWHPESEVGFSQNVPASGSDSYYWFRIAREIRDQGDDLGERDALRAWPEGLERGPTSALPWLIAMTSRAFDIDVYRAGIALNVFLSSLFIVPLGLYARAVGYPLAGLLGGFIGGLGHAYVQRSSVQRVDTDGGTLFFMFLLALAIGSLQSTAPPWRNRIAAALAGLCLAAFCRWYGQPWFWFVYAGTLGLHLLFGGFAWRQMIPLAAVFMLCANPLSALGSAAGISHFLQFYVLPSADTVPGPFDYASITRDITELQTLPPLETLGQIVDLPVVSALGLAGYVAFCVLRWRAALPLLPITLLGLYAIPGPERFGIFLAPLVGIGWGFVLHALAAAWRRSSLTGGRFAEPVAYLGAVAGAILLLPHTGFALAPKPSVPVRMIASLQRLAAELPPGSAVLANWGAGYLIEDVAGAATLNDGEAPDPLVHYLFSRAIASSDPLELLRIVEVLSTFGRRDLHAALDGSRDPQFAADALVARDASTAGNVVLLLTERDIIPFPSFFRTGRWSFANGEGPEDAYYRGDCVQADRRRLRCTHSDRIEFEIDLASGRLSGGQRLRRAVVIRDGRVAQETEYARGASITLELVQGDAAGSFTAYLVSEPVFLSNFNQLFFLGRFDSSTFEEIHHDPPVMRGFRIRATDRAERG